MEIFRLLLFLPAVLLWPFADTALQCAVEYTRLSSFILP